VFDGNNVTAVDVIWGLVELQVFSCVYYGFSTFHSLLLMYSVCNVTICGTIFISIVVKGSHYHPFSIFGIFLGRKCSTGRGVCLFKGLGLLLSSSSH
jgi:hypothetical protein